MKRPLATGIGLALAGLAAWALWGWLWPDEAARVRAAADRLAEAVTAVAGAGRGVEQVAALSALHDLLAEDVVVEVPGRTLRADGRDQVLALAAGLAARGRRGALSLADVGVTLSGDGLSAGVTATARVSGAGADGAPEFDAVEVALSFTRAGGTWRLREARAVDVLR